MLQERDQCYWFPLVRFPERQDFILCIREDGCGTVGHVAFLRRTYGRTYRRTRVGYGVYDAQSHTYSYSLPFGAVKKPLDAGLRGHRLPSPSKSMSSHTQGAYAYAYAQRTKLGPLQFLFLF